MGPPSRSWHGPFVHRGSGVRVLGMPPGHFMQRRDAHHAALLEVAHRLGLPGSAGAAACHPRFDDAEVVVAVVGNHPPGVEAGRGGRQQDLTGEPVDRVVAAEPAQLCGQPGACRAVQVPLGDREGDQPPWGGVAVGDRADQSVVERGIGDHVDGGRSAGQYPVLDA
jgi:hypothetical protein